MSDEDAPPPAPTCIDDLIDSACDVLDLSRVRGLNNDLERKMIEKVFEERNSSRLQTLVARVEAKFENQNHGVASVCASSASPLSAAIAPAASSEPEFQNHIQTHNSDLASLAVFAAVSEYRGPPKTRRGPKPRIVVTTADGTVSSSRSGLSTYKHEEFQQFAFANGKRHLAENRL
jgi:hypothetical protein